MEDESESAFQLTSRALSLPFIAITSHWTICVSSAAGRNGVNYPRTMMLALAIKGGLSRSALEIWGTLGRGGSEMGARRSLGRP